MEPSSAPPHTEATVAVEGVGRGRVGGVEKWPQGPQAALGQLRRREEGFGLVLPGKGEWRQGFCGEGWI